MSRERRLKKWLRLAYGVLSLRMSSVLLSGPKMKLFRATLGPTLSKTFQFYLLNSTYCCGKGVLCGLGIRVFK
jgi:hypothetical protein